MVLDVRTLRTPIVKPTNDVRARQVSFRANHMLIV